jgi:hypothetical protein
MRKSYHQLQIVILWLERAPLGTRLHMCMPPSIHAAEAHNTTFNSIQDKHA